MAEQSPSPPLHAATVAAIGYLNLSRSLKIENLPLNFNIIENDCWKHLLEHKSVENSRIHRFRTRTSAELCMIDIQGALKMVELIKGLAATEASFKGARVSYTDGDIKSIFPAWYKEDGKVHPRTITVAVTPETYRPLRSSIMKFERTNPTLLNANANRQQNVSKRLWRMIRHMIRVSTLRPCYCDLLRMTLPNSLGECFNRSRMNSA
ncbi:hypothetical protein IW261DRAFT_80145 [Armillaria novae-zelandiae]|uniref:Uncharacterized protein n=1 Tax=Armillaria novae-zelandiae TaxID=153914 RepID=A0AA39PVF1_9AGAR|nr:hypothetical protein IW261DRAFT_80145 [Armillaria novae-zelandiae]